uniref:Pilus assembly protein n=1 Tax=Schlesneria paludicola TaxID=360056 RepID=A0A7C2K020_9PLAN
MRRDSHWKRSAGPKGRRGIVVLEFILWTPVFVILLVSIVEFGLIWMNLQQVKAAANAGAKVASELTTAQLSSGLAANNIDLVEDAVQKVLGSAYMTPCRVILEYNPPNTCVPGSPGTKATTSSCPVACNAPSSSLPSTTDIPGGSVRVTVCVNINQLTPNLLSTFGFSISNRNAKMSTTLPYENCDG